MAVPSRGPFIVDASYDAEEQGRTSLAEIATELLLVESGLREAADTTNRGNLRLIMEARCGRRTVSNGPASAPALESGLTSASSVGTDAVVGLLAQG
jgi:hypothetical protein